MSERTRKLLPLILGVIGFLIVLGVGIYATNNQNSQSDLNAQTTPTTDQSVIVDPEEASDSHAAADLYISNLTFLEQWFSDTEYLFINNAILNFSHENYPDVDSYFIDETSFFQDGPEYRFTIRDGTNAKIFYVTVTRTAGNQLNLNFYKL